MVVEEVFNNTNDVLAEAVLEVGKIGKWLEAIGFIIIFWIVFQIISLIINNRKLKILYSIKSDLKRVEKKVDSLKGRR